MLSPPPRLRLSGLVKHFGGVVALDGVGFDIQPGCVHAVVGENGAGKSTLMKGLAGAVRFDAGTVELDGQPTHFRDSRGAQARGLAIVYQELSLVPQLSAGENVFLGRWPAGRFGWLDTRRLHAQAERIFARLGMAIPVRDPVQTLSVAQQQMVEIAKALSLQARVLILDEPSAVLTPHELTSLFRVVRELAAQGVTVLHVTHRLEEVFTWADYVTVLRDGRHISTRAIKDVTRAVLIAETVGRPLEESFPARRTAFGEVVLRLEGLGAPRRFTDVSLEVRAGEVWGLTGLVGSGRSSVARAIFGDLDQTTGRLVVGATPGPFRSPRQAQAAGVAYVPEDRKRQGLLLDRSVAENTTLAHLKDVARGGFIRRRRERQTTRHWIQTLAIKTTGTTALAHTLSGGNQQKLLLARWLQRPYRVLLLDEPTRGVDVGAKAEIYEIMARLAAGGAAVVLVSSEFPEVLGLADRIGVMRAGRLVGVLDNSGRDVSQETILRLAAGVRTE